MLDYELTTDGKTCVLSEKFLMFSRNDHIGVLSVVNTHYFDILQINGLKEAR